MTKRFVYAAAILAGLTLVRLCAARPDADPDEKKATLTKSGLKYFDAKVGDGKEAKDLMLVEVHYVGTLRDGTKFDSSRDRKKPFTFPLGASMVIKGWDEGVAGMKVGGTRKLYIPSELAYGKRGAGNGKIPPDSDLIFEVELLDVKPGVTIDELKVGDGATAKRGDTVEVHYTGWLKSNGKKFDSSVDRKEPLSFQLGVGDVIPGWDIGVAGMKVGGKRKLTIASTLAYGKRGSGDDIPADADLVFEVELLKVK